MFIPYHCTTQLFKASCLNFRQLNLNNCCLFHITPQLSCLLGKLIQVFDGIVDSIWYISYLNEKYTDVKSTAECTQQCVNFCIASRHIKITWLSFLFPKYLAISGANRLTKGSGGLRLSYRTHCTMSPLGIDHPSAV